MKRELSDYPPDVQGAIISAQALATLAKQLGTAYLNSIILYLSGKEPKPVHLESAQPAGVAECMATYIGDMRTDLLSNLESRHLLPDMDIRCIRAEPSPELVEQGTVPEGWVMVVIDVRTREQAEREARGEL